MLILDEPRASDWWVTALWVASLLAAIIVAAVWLPWWVAVAIVVVGLPLLVWWHARSFGYRCAECGAEFTVSAVEDAMAMSWFTSHGAAKRVHCPSCGTRAFMRVLVVRRTSSRTDSSHGGA
jgi:DNA-directed RNA polymerase subunit RPC12/RpoP